MNTNSDIPFRIANFLNRVAELQPGFLDAIDDFRLTATDRLVDEVLGRRSNKISLQPQQRQGLELSLVDVIAAIGAIAGDRVVGVYEDDERTRTSRLVGFVLDSDSPETTGVNDE